MSELSDKLSKFDQEMLARLYKRVFDSIDAKLVLQDLKNRCYYDAPLPIGENGQRAEGARGVILNINTMLDYKPLELPQEEINVEND